MIMTYQKLYNDIINKLKKNNLPTKIARLTFEYVLKLDIEDIYKNFYTKLTNKQIKKITKIINKVIKNNIPIEYILGYTYFYDLKIKVNKHTLIPRPETEYLVSYIIKHIIKNKTNLKILDLCTGSGAIALSLSKYTNQKIVATDISKKALKVAKYNSNNLKTNIQFIKSNLFNNLGNNKYDLIISNPPYISTYEELPKSVLKEPHIALYAGSDGLDIIKLILKEANNYLNDNGVLIIEHAYNHHEKIVKLTKNYFTNYKINYLLDLQNKKRFTIIKKGE